jgi:quinoprotein glucose dehydrogenase
VLALVACASIALLARQGVPAQAGPSGAQNPAAQWPTFGGNLASQRYSSLDQINKDNFSKLEIAWRFKTDHFGPSADNLYENTPLMVNGVLYTTAGTMRDVIALNPATGEMLWMYRIDEGPRGQGATRRGAGRGVSFLVQSGWYRSARHLRHSRLSADCIERENWRAGLELGKNGIVDLRLENDQNLDPLNSAIGLNATPLVAGDVVVVGAAHSAQGNPAGVTSARGYVRGFDARTGKRPVDLSHRPDGGRVRLRHVAQRLGLRETATQVSGRR